MVFIETDMICSKCMYCKRGEDGKSLKNRPGHLSPEKLPCIQEIHNSYHPNVENSESHLQSNMSLVYNEPSDSYFYFNKFSIPAATNTSSHANVHEEGQKCVYEVMPKAEIKRTQNNETSPDLDRFSYNWVDTTPTVVSVMRSVTNVDKSKATAKSKSDSSGEMFNVKKRKCIKPPLNRTKIFRNVKMDFENKRKGTLALKSSSCKDTLETAMNNLCGFFEDLLQTTLRTDSNLDTGIKDVKCESNPSSPSSHDSSIDNKVDSEADTALKKHEGTVSWDFTTNTSPSIMTDLDWADDGYKEFACNTTSKDKPQIRTTVTSKESLYTEINASSFVDLRRKPDNKRKRSYIPNVKILNKIKRDANIDSPKKKARKTSHKKQIISYLKKRLNDGDNKDHFNNGPQSEFFKSLKNIAFLKHRLSKEHYFFDEPKSNASKKYKCAKVSNKHSNSKNRRTSAKAVKRKIK